MRARLAVLAVALALAACGDDWRPPVDLYLKGGEHHLDWSLGMPF